MRKKRQFSKLPRCAKTLFRLDPLHSNAPCLCPLLAGLEAGTLTENDISDLAVTTPSSAKS